MGEAFGVGIPVEVEGANWSVGEEDVYDQKLNIFPHGSVEWWFPRGDAGMDCSKETSFTGLGINIITGNFKCSVWWQVGFLNEDDMWLYFFY